MNKKLSLIIIMFILFVGLIVIYIVTRNKDVVVFKIGQNQVITKNFLKNPARSDQYNTVIKETPDYIINYYDPDRLFGIAIFNKDINYGRSLAEQDFLKILNISKNDACKLKIELRVPFSVNDAAGGINYNLSFCPNGIVFP